ncbi:MAG TPA: bifunctional oligoribonuclease/PAP phosphatase NrnA [Elusimicrobiales bacterium]|nr:bifunctional oligoribonuclease/PAP phosphatase NrnA [Elusimicrobiales bacterium]
MQRPEPAQIARLLRKSRNCFIAVHQSPDGDTLGCALALYSVLRRMGKKALVFSSDPIPPSLSFLPNVQKVVLREPPERRFDTVVMMECSTPARAGNVCDVLAKAGTIINIDHHRTFTPYGTVNYVDKDASSTSEMLYGVFIAMKIRLTKREAACLYAGLATDTGRFHYPVTSPRTHEVAAGLLRAGAPAAKINKLVYDVAPLPALKVLGLTLTNLKLIHGGKTAVSELRLKDMKAVGAVASDAEGVVNRGLMVPGVQVSVLFREDAGRINVNFRSTGRVDVSALARSFGGGGHKNASGCKMRLPLAKCRRLVLGAIEKSY